MTQVGDWPSQKDHMIIRLGLWATWYQHNIQGIKGNIDGVQWHSQRFDQSCLHNATPIKSLEETPGASPLLVDSDLYPCCYSETAFVSIVLSANSESHSSELMNPGGGRNSQICSQLARTVGVWESPSLQLLSEVKAVLWRKLVFLTCEVQAKSR